MFDDLEYLMKQVTDMAPPGGVDPNKLEKDLRLGRAENQTSPQLRQLAQADIPVESFVRIASQQTKKEEPRNINPNGYDMESAKEFESATGMSLYDPASQRWGSRIFMGPNKGLILKDPEHSTFNKTLRGERRAGYTLMRRTDPKGNITKYNGRLFSFSSDDKYDHSLYQPVSLTERKKYRYMPYNIPSIADSIVRFEVVEDAPHTWGYDKDSDSFKVYNDSKGIPTIGIGGNIGPERKNDFMSQLEVVAPHKSYEDILSGRIGLTRPEVDQIFMMNVREHTLTAEDIKVKLDDGIIVYPFEDLSEFPEYLQQAIVNGVFWSMLTPKTSPNAMELIAKGKWAEAGVEFKTGRWQTEMKAKGGSTWDRFIVISDAFTRYDKELKNTKDSGYVMKEGQTLWSVSQELDITVEDLQKMNPELDTNSIPIGYKLKTESTIELTADTKEGYISPSISTIKERELSEEDNKDNEGFWAGILGVGGPTYGERKLYINESNWVQHQVEDAILENIKGKSVSEQQPKVDTKHVQRQITEAVEKSVRTDTEMKADKEFTKEMHKVIEEGDFLMSEERIKKLQDLDNLKVEIDILERSLEKTKYSIIDTIDDFTDFVSERGSKIAKLSSELQLLQFDMAVIELHGNNTNINYDKYKAAVDEWYKHAKTYDELYAKYGAKGERAKPLDDFLRKTKWNPSKTPQQHDFLIDKTLGTPKFKIPEWHKDVYLAREILAAKNPTLEEVETFTRLSKKLGLDKTWGNLPELLRSRNLATNQYKQLKIDNPSSRRKAINNLKKINSTLMSGLKVIDTSSYAFLSPKENIGQVQGMREGLNTKAGKAGGAVFFLYSMIGLLRSIEDTDSKDLTEGWQGPWFREWMKGTGEMALGGPEAVKNMTIDNLMYYITSIYKPREQLRILAEIPKSLKDVFIEPLLWVSSKMEGYDTPPVTPMNAIRGQSTPSGQYPPSVQQ
jgi:hypothetical protein